MLALAATLVLLITAAAAGQTSAVKPAQSPSKTRSIMFWNMSRTSVDFHIQHVPQADSERLAELSHIFTGLECRGSSLRQQAVGDGKNLLCTLPGTGAVEDLSEAKPGTILLIAHYEHMGHGESAIDNWSGAVMLPFVFHALSATPRRHTFLFAEVDGEAGSKALFDSMTPDERDAIQGVVALDALGLGPAQCFINPLDERDIARYSAVRWLGLELMQASADQRFPKPVITPYSRATWLRVDATEEFREHNIPAITIHSVTWRQRHLPGSSHDTAAAINGDFYFNTYTLLADYAVELDQSPPPPPDIAPFSTREKRR